MLALLASVVGKIVGWIAGVLPVSPFANQLGSVPAALDLGLAWLNTIIPVSDILAMIGVWASAMMLYCAVKIVSKWTIGKVTGVISVD